MTKVFISYARSDQEFALRLAKALEADGFDIWIDQLHIETGRHWDTEIQTALELCPAFLLILSPASVASRNVQDEVSFALELEKDIVPVLYQPCNIPFRVRRHQYVDFTVGEEQGLAKFLESLKRLKAPKQPMVKAVGNVKTWPTATVNQGDLRRQKEAQYRAEGRIRVDAKIVHGAPDGPASHITKKLVSSGGSVPAEPMPQMFSGPERQAEPSEAEFAEEEEAYAELLQECRERMNGNAYVELHPELNVGLYISFLERFPKGRHSSAVASEAYNMIWQLYSYDFENSSEFETLKGLGL